MLETVVLREILTEKPVSKSCYVLLWKKLVTPEKFKIMTDCDHIALYL